MTFKGTLRAGLMGLACCLATIPAAMANSVTLNLKDAEINTLIATVSEVTGRNFIIDPRVKARVTVISATPMSPEGVYETFLAVLQVYGFAAIPAGEAIKIVPETNARQDGGSATSVSPRTAQDEIVTRVMQIQNVPAAQLVPILRPLVPQWGHLAAYSPSNMLIIADRAANVVRLERIIADIDRGGDREIEMIRLEHAAASEVVRILTGLGQQGQQQDPTQRPATIIADERSNAVLIGGDKSERQKFIDIIRSLDIPLADDGATQVVYLRFANAENLAPILEGFAEQAAAAEGSGGTIVVFIGEALALIDDEFLFTMRAAEIEDRTERRRRALVGADGNAADIHRLHLEGCARRGEEGMGFLDGHGGPFAGVLGHFSSP